MADPKKPKVVAGPPEILRVMKPKVTAGPPEILRVMNPKVTAGPPEITQLRVDGTKKSDQGFLGPITNNVTGETMTEVSIQFDDVLGGKPIPLLVPGLTQDEINQIKNMRIEGNARNLPQTAVRKAIAHAKQRDQKGLSPFYEKQPIGGTMPSEDMMKKLDDELEAAIAAKKAQDIINTLTKIRNEQDAYDMMMNKQLKADQKRMSSQAGLENEMKAAEMTGGLKNIDDYAEIEKMEKTTITPIQKKNYKKLPDLIKKGEDALMDLEED